MSARGQEARRRNRALRNGNPATQPLPLPIDSGSYVAQQLSRTRKQIDLLNDLLESKAVLADPRLAKAAADAKARLYEVESALAGRPKPGMLRPTAEKPRRQVQQDYGPVTPPLTPGPITSPDTTAPPVEPGA